MTTFHSITDIRRYISSCLECIQVSEYKYEYEDLVESVTLDFRNLIWNKGYRYGNVYDDEMVDEKEFWEIVNQFMNPAKSIGISKKQCLGA